jgi:hypothetical protein
MIRIKSFSLGIFLPFVLFSLIQCSSCKQTFTTGLQGKIDYGEGDCMPTISTPDKEFKAYNGELFFINKIELDNLGFGDLESLKYKSIHCHISNGNIDLELKPGTYVIMPNNLYEYSGDNTIQVKQGEMVAKDFQFWKCITY